LQFPGMLNWRDGLINTFHHSRKSDHMRGPVGGRAVPPTFPDRAISLTHGVLRVGHSASFWIPPDPWIAICWPRLSARLPVIANHAMFRLRALCSATRALMTLVS